MDLQILVCRCWHRDARIWSRSPIPANSPPSREIFLKISPKLGSLARTPTTAFGCPTICHHHFVHFCKKMYLLRATFFLCMELWNTDTLSVSTTFFIFAKDVLTRGESLVFKVIAIAYHPIFHYHCFHFGKKCINSKLPGSYK